MPLEGFLDALGGGGADALVDGQCLLQVLRGVAGVAVVEVAVADAFQGAGFLPGRAEVTGDGQRLGVLVAGLAGGLGPGRWLAELVQRFGLAEPVAEVAEQFEARWWLAAAALWSPVSCCTMPRSLRTQAW